MMNRGARTARLAEEMRKLAETPPWGITCKPKVDDTYDVLVANIQGPEGSPYEKGIFDLEVHLSDKYPFEPPYIKLITPIRHPNIDSAGRICLDILVMPPKGSWLPTTQVETVLVAFQALLAYPNAEDPLDPDIATEYKFDHENFLKKARETTEKFAMMKSL
ncbi:ubiquitin-conjugating enzyme E2 T-like [Epargyreus clarus]|uniref:ubiquitin-conjugating enzyme E2 T-like n=1 Tax=Epargyreus clarus TaxID=520877 RepID=UPI003C2AB764